MKKKKKRERKKEFRGKGKKRKRIKKKKIFCWLYTGQVISAGVLSVQREGVVGRIGFTFLSSWVTLFAVL